MNMEKNTLVQVQIEDMTEQGEGIGKVDGYTLFIKDTVVGDFVEAKVIKVKKRYGYGKLLRILTPSPDRVEPLCPVAGPCGGCQLQAMSYASQLAFKRRKVENHLRRLGGLDVPVEPVLGMEDPWEYRNKCQVPVGRNRDGRIICGFYAGHTHSIIETEHCYLGNEINDQVLRLVKNHMERYGIEPYDEATGRGLVRHILVRQGRATGEIMVCLVVNGRRLPHADRLVETLCAIPGMTSISLNVNRQRNNVILGQELINLYGPGHIVDRIGDISYQISPLSFYQVNPVQTEKLYATALDFAGLTGNETVWDLYCGIGTISLFLAKQAKQVYGVEIVPAAIENARENAVRNGIDNAEFFIGRAEEVLPDHYRKVWKETGEKLRADVIVVDPPRKGCDEKLLDTMLQMQPERIVYVSCDSATLARDLRVLCGGGYQVKKVQPVDMFPMGVHVECIAKIEKKNSGEVLRQLVDQGFTTSPISDYHY
ncbi:MAG: 23S rRNA (uracil(1939)-C(5))-methyltransferase RlmD [Lachnospiraceae bacterium]|nr:23S rRNA (uracil(1939)-C(5))-methyltransferase RlmD [Lachnospiraceae bacterium]